MIFHLREAGAGGVPFLFEFPLANFEAQLFATQTFELQGEIFALLREGTSLVENRCYLLLKCGFAAFKLGALLVQPHGQSFGGHEPLVHCGELGAACGSSFCSDWMDPRRTTRASASRALSASASARLSAAAA